MEDTLVINRVAEPVEVPGRIKIAPWGHFTSSTTGGQRIPSLVDEEAFALMNAAFIEHGVDIPIDYEHQTLGGQYASSNGQAPAAGWIKSIHAVPGSGVFAEVEWTPTGAIRVRNKEYRYPSIVSSCRQSDGRLVSLHSVALTNTPAVDGMDPIVNSLPAFDAETQVIANQAGAEWDAQPGVQAFCSRQAYINEAIREESQASADANAETSQPTDTSAGTSRAIASRAGAEWDAQPGVQAFCSRQAYIKEAIREESQALANAEGKTTQPADISIEAVRAIANQAGEEWDIHPGVQKICSRQRYVEQAIRERTGTDTAIV